ncbi:hypothetical protein H0H10_26660 [Streptomyces sp. TRM S81-3]|uniref:Transmembrane protein n=1 Tax=Streptomyces griseicoloratus TaxID=2752516 RepID=A0A926L9N4_9ACTN|nr:hypothetical protein [Streptomyces griseicoloratus]MBD0422697.1 hypothetical protein [Streptomyces griseicoloratus]
MSARDPQHASGPLPPRKEHTSKKANPLRRPSDRFESWFLRFLMSVLVLGLPVAAIGAGLTAYESSMRTVHAQAAERQEVTARLTSDVKGDAEVPLQQAQVRWTDGDGAARTGTALVKSGTPKDAAVQVWVDREGRLTSQPMTELQARSKAWFVGGMAAVGVGAGVFAARSVTRHLLDRGRYARWDAEWDLVEPLWSARFRR